MAELTCPGCGRGCSLDAPHCPRGEEYARTGVLPERPHGHEHGHEHERHHHGHGHDPVLDMGDEADINVRLALRLRHVGHILRFLQEERESQKRALIFLSKSGAMTQRELTEKMRIQPGSASELFGKLEGAGLIVRTENAADRRTADIRLTDAGTAQAQETLAQYQSRRREMFACLTEEEKESLLALLTRLTQDWETRYPKPERRGHDRAHEDRKGERG